MKNRHVGVLLIGFATLLFVVVMAFSNALETVANNSCTHENACPMRASLNTLKTVNYILIAVLIGVGIFIMLFMKDEQVTVAQNIKIAELAPEEKKAKMQGLDEEEKTVMNIILRENGSAYQSDLIRETSMTKVKISRILDRLEGKGLIERKRRGMTNVVILK